MGDFATGLKDSLEVIAPYLQQMAEKIGEGGQFIFGIYVKQAYVLGVTDLLCLLTGFGLLGASVKMIFNEISRIGKVEQSDEFKLSGRNRSIYNIPPNDDINIKIAVCAILGFLGIILIFTTNVHEMLTCLINPEYNALQTLIKQLK